MSGGNSHFCYYIGAIFDKQNFQFVVVFGSILRINDKL